MSDAEALATLCAKCGSEVEAVGENAEATCPTCDEPVALDSRFLLHRVLGRGAFGIVYDATNIADGSRVAIKEVVVGRARGDGGAAAEREVASFAGLDHPGLPRLLESFVLDADCVGVAYLVQEMVDGRSLRAELSERRHTSAEIFTVLAETLEILAQLHGAEPRIVHRDVKLDNLMRRRDGQLVLVDLGSAAVSAAEVGTDHMTSTGTVGYMPVEQIAGITRAANDIYAVGALGVSLLTRREPVMLLDANHRLRWEPLVTLHPRQRRWLRALLRVNPDERPEDAAALAVEARALGALAPPERRIPWAPLAVLLALVVVASFVYGGTMTSPDTEVAVQAPVEPPTPAPVEPPTPVPAEPPATPSPPRVIFEDRPERASRCVREASCLDLADGFEGIDLRASSRFGAAVGAGVVASVGERQEVVIGDLTVPCRRRSTPFGVLVTCFHARGLEPSALAAHHARYLQYIRDRYGPELSAVIQGARQTHRWRSGAFSLEVAATLPAADCEVGGRPCRTDMRTHYNHLDGRGLDSEASSR